MARTFAQIHFTGEGFRTLGVYRLFFAAALRDELKRRAEYDAEVRDWYENGDGRPRSEGGKGHSFPVCIHGTSLWTDYDNICYGCEEGETAIQSAIGAARERWLRFNDRWDWLQSAPGDLPIDVRREIEVWTTRLFPKPVTS